MLNTPHEYASWLPLLDRFREGDDSVLDLMHQGSIPWSSVVAERWTMQVSSALEARLKRVSKQLQLHLDRARGDGFAIARALLDARRALQPLWHFVAIPCLPANVGDHLKSELTRWASETQAALEKHAGEIRADNGRLLKTIRDNSLTRAADGHLPPAAKGAEPPPPSGRRVIL